MEFVDVDKLEHLWAVHNSRICLDARIYALVEVHVYS